MASLDSPLRAFPYKSPGCCEIRPARSPSGGCRLINGAAGDRQAAIVGAEKGMAMKRLLAMMLALLLVGLAAPVLGAVRHHPAHAPRHRHYPRVSGRLISPVLRPAPPACRDNRARNALGRCPAPPACPGGRARTASGQCPTIFCARGARPNAFGHCPARATPRRARCPGGGLRSAAGQCATPTPCPGGLTRDLGGVCPLFPPCTTNGAFLTASGWRRARCCRRRARPRRTSCPIRRGTGSRRRCIRPRLTSPRIWRPISRRT